MTKFLDFNGAEPQREGELIPDGTVAPVNMKLRPGGHGDGGWLKRSKSGEALMLDCEFTVIEGPNARRKFWTLFTVSGETDGQQKAADISRSKLRAIIESARGINPADEREAAMNGRRVSSYEDLDGIQFVAVVGLEPGKGEYKDKNILKAAVTPDRNNWWQVSQPAKTRTAQTPSGPAMAAKAPASTGKPSWAS